VFSCEKVALTLDEYNSSLNTIKDALPDLSTAEFDFKTVDFAAGSSEWIGSRSCGGQIHLLLV
jgi:hypothetical protein